MKIKEAKYIRDLISEIEDYTAFLEELQKGTNFSDYAIVNMELMSDGKYFPHNLRLKSHSLISVVAELLESKKKELERIGFVK